MWTIEVGMASWLCPCEMVPALRTWVASTRGVGMSALEKSGG